MHKTTVGKVVELQSIAQAGIFYGRDPYDIERYQRNFGRNHGYEIRIAC